MLNSEHRPRSVIYTVHRTQCIRLLQQQLSFSFYSAINHKTLRSHFWHTLGCSRLTMAQNIGSFECLE